MDSIVALSWVVRVFVVNKCLRKLYNPAFQEVVQQAG